MMNKKGLSLVELIVCLAVMAVISGVALVSFSLADRRKLETTAIDLRANLILARQRAINEQQIYTANFSTANETCTITGGGDPLDPSRPVQRLAPVDIHNSSPDSLQFQEDGTISLTGSDIIYLEHRGRRKRIKIYEQTAYLRFCSEPTDAECP